MAMKTYRATETGFDGVAIREPGELFTTDIPKGSWMEEVDARGNVVETAPSAATGKQPLVDPGPLDASIRDLTAYLEGVSDLGAVEALLAAEKAGKSRVGAIEEIEARITALKA